MASATMASAPKSLLTDLLRQVSRSFYLTLRVLPSSIRPQIGLAYLLARTTDTIADTLIVPVPDRLRTLELLRERILGTSAEPLDLTEFTAEQGSPAEWMLLERIEEALEYLNSLPMDDQQLIRIVLTTIAGGQELDLRRFDGASKEAVVSLDTDAELDDYTYRVAGCVGEFWTRICRTHVYAGAELDDESLLADGVRFGKGLQLVNILRDLPRDLRQGRCYLPSDRLWTVGLTPAELLQPSNEAKLRPLYDALLTQAEEHLTAGWRYTNRLPRSPARIRLACAWPILIGMQTIAKLRTGPVLAPELRLKVTRSEIRGILWRTIWALPRRRAWEGLFPGPMRPDAGNMVDSDAGAG